MLLSTLTATIPHRRTGADTDISRVEYDSRKVLPGDLFCCIVGLLSDGHDFARQALEAGAVALLVVQAYVINHLAGIDYPRWSPRTTRAPSPS